MRITTVTTTILADHAIHTTVKKVDSRHEHDCENCLFFGCHNEYDLYFCPTPKELIARYGEEGEYFSVRAMHLGHWTFKTDDPLKALADKLAVMNLI